MKWFCPRIFSAHIANPHRTANLFNVTFSYADNVSHTNFTMCGRGEVFHRTWLEFRSNWTDEGSMSIADVSWYTPYCSRDTLLYRNPWHLRTRDINFFRCLENRVKMNHYFYSHSLWCSFHRSQPLPAATWCRNSNSYWISYPNPSLPLVMSSGHTFWMWSIFFKTQLLFIRFQCFTIRTLNTSSCLHEDLTGVDCSVWWPHSFWKKFLYCLFHSVASKIYRRKF